MRIGVPAETRPGETRVAITPETAKKLKAQGHSLHIQSGAGMAASVTDAASAKAVMQEHASTIKRPVIAWPSGQITVGFTPEQWPA